MNAIVKIRQVVSSSNRRCVVGRLGLASLFAAICLVCSTSVAAPYASYSIGNSLTWNLVNPVAGGGKLAALAGSKGHPMTTGSHIRGSAPLNYMYANPNDVTAGNWPAALPNYHWDAVTFQPYPTSISPVASTLATDTSTINQWIDVVHTYPGNEDTKFFIYAAWPNIVYGGADDLVYQTQWLREGAGESTDPTILAREYFEDLFESVRVTRPDIRLIPAGEVLYAVDSRMRNGEIPGLTSVSTLYSDSYHLNELGAHLVAATAFATLFGESPVGLPYSGTPAVSDESLLLMQQTAWDVVREQSYYTGVPEPTTLSLVAFATGAMLVRRRKS